MFSISLGLQNITTHTLWASQEFETHKPFTAYWLAPMIEIHCFCLSRIDLPFFWWHHLNFLLEKQTIPHAWSIGSCRCHLLVSKGTHDSVLTIKNMSSPWVLGSVPEWRCNSSQLTEVRLRVLRELQAKRNSLYSGCLVMRTSAWCCQSPLVKRAWQREVDTERQSFGIEEEQDIAWVSGSICAWSLTLCFLKNLWVLPQFERVLRPHTCPFP